MLFYESCPVFDSFVDENEVPCIFIDYVRIGGEELCIKKHFPHLSLYLDPFKSIFDCENAREDETETNFGWGLDLFIDEYNLNVGNDTQTLEPAGGYWSSPNMLSFFSKFIEKISKKNV